MAHKHIFLIKRKWMQRTGSLGSSWLLADMFIIMVFSASQIEAKPRWEKWRDKKIEKKTEQKRLPLSALNDTHIALYPPCSSVFLTFISPSLSLLAPFSSSWLYSCMCCCPAAFWGCVPATCLMMETCLWSTVHCVLPAFCSCQTGNSSET